MNRVIDAVGQAHALPPLSHDEPAAALQADGRAVQHRVEDLASVGELADGLEGRVTGPLRIAALVSRLHPPGVGRVEHETRRAERYR